MTNRNNFVVGGLAFPSSLFDDHWLAILLSQVERLTGMKPKEVFVYRGYHSHGVAELQDFILGQKHWVNAWMGYTGLNLRIVLKMTRILCADFCRRLIVSIEPEKSMPFLALQRYCPYA